MTPMAEGEQNQKSAFDGMFLLYPSTNIFSGFNRDLNDFNCIYRRRLGVGICLVSSSFTCSITEFARNYKYLTIEM
ncbi:hypothetical protein [Undibacterium pigrum]|uniref:hypothetical protein n=1 Tax=Undibacterium pigrum TaxID=401470 RepID=UPI0011B41440|nr:hypothetical protein [Undibacterium pigrum]